MSSGTILKKLKQIIVVDFRQNYFKAFEKCNNGKSNI
jgi:hypothetical protein